MAGGIDLGRSVERRLSAVVRGSAQHAKAVVAVVAVLTLVALAVVVAVEPNVETDIQAGYFATDDPQANAFRALREDVAGVNSEIVYFELRTDARHGGREVRNVTSQEALAAQEELFGFVKQRFAERTGHDKVLSHTSLAYFVKLIYAQFPNGCYCLPADPNDHATAVDLVFAAGGEALGLYHSEDFRSAVMFIIYDPDTTFLSKKETGGLINQIIEEYRRLGAAPGTAKQFDIWEPAYLDSWGVQSWIWRIDEQVAKESTVFIVAVFVFLTATLMFLFRNLKRTLIGVSTVAIILLWTVAGMTLGGVSIGFISMAMFPLLLGVGVDYVIHIINEFGVERAHTPSSDDAFDLIGRRGAVALLISTLTTISGFLVMISSTSPMIVEIGTATVLGIASVFLLSVTFVPAMLELSVRNEAREVFRPSRAVGAWAAWVGRNKAPVIVLLVLGTVLFAAYVPKTEHVIGTVEVNLPQRAIWTGEPDRSSMLVMYERFSERIRTTGQETVITQGGGAGTLATRAAVDDMIAIHRAMVDDPFVRDSGGAVNSVPFILNLYAILKDGIGSAVPTVGQDILFGGAVVGLPSLDPAYDPTFRHIQDWDDGDIRAAYDDMMRREEWQPLLLTFMDADYSIAWALTFVNIPIDQEATVKADQAFQNVLATAAPSATENHYFGTLTGLKKYNDYTTYWLTLSGLVSLGIVCLLVGLFTGRLRPVIAVAIPMGLTFVWWLGALATPVVGIQIAFVFLIPVAFITSLGSDYAVHLAWNLERQADPRFVFKTVGKAVAYSGFTTGTAFLIFTRGAIRGSWEMFEACVIAILIMTVLTFLTFPLIYMGRGVQPGRATSAGAHVDPTGPKRF